MKVTWQKNMRFCGHTDSGHEVVMDAAPEVGGENKGPRPMEMVLLGLGGCTSIDVMMMLQKSKQAVTDCEVELTSERAETIPKVFTRIHVRFHVYGEDLNEKKVARAVNLSAEKYCSVSKMLENSVELTHDYHIHPPKA
ncbi:OsmC family protein [Hydrogenovibrio halophilus]|uniref:OsmC family protein n=1 Tax=Hydrogenovibrio halophilus TaxID=373391 RepID=UPI000377E2E6|nr:OsmC family protein [Hydrogenovibrio halophilus]